MDTCDTCLGFRCTWPASFPARGGERTGKAAAGLMAGSVGPRPPPGVWGPRSVPTPLPLGLLVEARSCAKDIIPW